MARVSTLLLIIILSLPGVCAYADNEDIEAPSVILSGVSIDISTDAPGTDRMVVLQDGAVIASVHGPARLLITDLSVADTGEVSVQVLQGETIIAEQEISVIPAWASLLPPLVAIILAFTLRSVIPSLFCGLLVGAWAINGMTAGGAVTGFFETVTIYILEAVVDRGHASIILFSLLIGGMVGVVSKNGGMVGIVNRVITFANTPKRGQRVIAGLGLAIFFDDYANTMIVGNATRPVSDHLRISREKLAYLVDSTAAPVATVAVITTWIGFQIGLIEDAIAELSGIDQAAYALFLQSIPYSFYPFLAVFLVFLVVITGKDFGPMYQAELRARSTGQVCRHSGSAEDAADEMADFDHKPDIPCRAINAVLPILSLVGGVIGGIYISGEGETLQDIVGSADAYIVLIWASLLSCLVATVLTLGQRILTLEEIVDAWLVGSRFMLNGLLMLVMAWAIADITNALQTANFLVSLLAGQLSPYTLPAVVFMLAALAAFGTGTSWGVMAILMPLVVPLCWAVMELNNIANAEHMYIFYSCIASVMAGSVWADHCSPIADTTVLSSLATGCNHMDHVTTQIPYALLGGIVALVLGNLPVGYGVPWWVLMPIAAVVIFIIHRWLARCPEEGAKTLAG